MFLVDAIGAFASSIFLGIVLPEYSGIFGFPLDMLEMMATIPVVFITYDIVIFFANPSKLYRYIRVIATANILYCLLSFILALQNNSELTFWGWYYISSEILIISILVVIEYSVSNKIKVSSA